MMFICADFEVLQYTEGELKIETTVPSFRRTLRFVYMNVLLLSISKKKLSERSLSWSK